MFCGTRPAPCFPPAQNFRLRNRHLESRRVSVIEFREFEDHGWHAANFATLEDAQDDLEQWWFHMCRGEAYRQ